MRKKIAKGLLIAGMIICFYEAGVRLYEFVQKEIGYEEIN
jgi:hypothetical protein